jgi:hypothetical protein
LVPSYPAVKLKSVLSERKKQNTVQAMNHDLSPVCPLAPIFFSLKTFVFTNDAFFQPLSIILWSLRGRGLLKRDCAAKSPLTAIIKALRVIHGAR